MGHRRREIRTSCIIEKITPNSVSVPVAITMPLARPIDVKCHPRDGKRWGADRFALKCPYKQYTSAQPRLQLPLRADLQRFRTCKSRCFFSAPLFRQLDYFRLFLSLWMKLCGCRLEYDHRLRMLRCRRERAHWPGRESSHVHCAPSLDVSKSAVECMYRIT